MFVCLCICVFVYLCICVFVYLSICVFVYLCVCVFVCLCVCVFVRLCICVFVCLCFCIFVFLYVCVFECLRSYPQQGSTVTASDFRPSRCGAKIPLSTSVDLRFRLILYESIHLKHPKMEWTLSRL